MRLQDVGVCDRWNVQVVNQLKVFTGGYGFVMTPTENGDAICELYAGTAGKVFEGKLSELFPGEEGFAVCPTYAVFDSQGKNVTGQILQFTMKRAIEKKSASVDPFSALRK